MDRTGCCTGQQPASAGIDEHPSIEDKVRMAVHATLDGTCPSSFLPPCDGVNGVPYSDGQIRVAESGLQPQGRVPEGGCYGLGWIGEPCQQDARDDDSVVE